MNDLRETKIAHFDEALTRAAGNPSSLLHDENVCRLKIAVKDSFVVRRFNARDYLTQKVC